jgi:hypothetical protein
MSDAPSDQQQNKQCINSERAAAHFTFKLNELGCCYVITGLSFSQFLLEVVLCYAHFRSLLAAERINTSTSIALLSFVDDSLFSVLI